MDSLVEGSARIMSMRTGEKRAWYIEYTTLTNPRKRVKGHDGWCKCRVKAGDHCRHYQAAWREKQRIEREIQESGGVREKGIAEFVAAYEKWVKGSDLASGTQRLYIHALKRFAKYCQETRVRELPQVRRKSIDDFQTNMKLAGAKNATINNYMKSLGAVFTKAKEWGVVEKNPFSPREFGQRTLMQKTPDSKQPNFLTATEIYTLKNGLSGRWRDMFVLFINTGLRLGELTNLRFEQYRDGSLYIEQRADWKPKSRNRRVTLNKEAIAVLENRKQAKVQAGVYFPNHYVFGNSFGGKLLNRNVIRAFQKAFKRFGIRGALQSGVSVHTLRHTYSTYLGLANIPAIVIQSELGHSDLKTTERYLHTAKQQNAEFINGFSYSDFQRNPNAGD